MAGSLPAPDPSGSLKRDALGTGGLVFMVVAAATPLTVMAGVAPPAIMVGGIGAPVGCARIVEGDSETHATTEKIPA